MEFFGLEVKPGKSVSYLIEAGKTLRITQASLGESIQTDTRSVLTINVGGQKHVIAILLPGKSEHTVMDLIFEEQKLEFTVTGKNSIHLAGNLMANEDEDDEDDDDDEDGPRRIMGGDDDEEDEDDDDADGDEDDDDEDEEEDEDEEDDEDEAPAAKPQADSKKRPPPASPAAPVAKQQKTSAPQSAKKDVNPASAKKENVAAAKPATPAPDKKEGGAKTPADFKKPGTPAPSKSAPGTPSTPGTPAKPIPADVKDKIRDLLKTAKDGVIRAGEFPREYEKKYGKPYKEVYEGLGYKKLTESLKAIPDLIQVEGENIKLKAKK